MLRPQNVNWNYGGFNPLQQKEVLRLFLFVIAENLLLTIVCLTKGQVNHFFLPSK